MKKGVALLSVSLASLLLAACGSQPSAQKQAGKRLKIKVF